MGLIMHNINPKNKYSAKPNYVDGYRFDSRKEARRYSALKLLKDAGDVLMFLRQVPFHLPGGVTYRADFLIFWSDGTVTVEDTKGYQTQQFKDKKKLVEALYPIKIHLKASKPESGYGHKEAKEVIAGRT